MLDECVDVCACLFVCVLVCSCVCLCVCVRKCEVSGCESSLAKNSRKKNSLFVHIFVRQGTGRVKTYLRTTHQTAADKDKQPHSFSMLNASMTCRHTIGCIRSTCKATWYLCVSYLALAGVGVFLQSYSQQMEREMITVTDQTYKVFNGIQRSLDVLQDMYAQKKAMCINHDDTVKEKEEVYRLSLSKVRAMKEMYDEAVKESETAKNNLADATAEKYKVCVIADGLHHSARPLQDFIQDMTDYLNRQESN